MRKWQTVGILALCAAASVPAIQALNGSRARPGAAVRPRRKVLDVAALETPSPPITPLLPVTERTRFEQKLRVKDPSGKEVRLDFGRGKHIVVFAGCT